MGIYGQRFAGLRLSIEGDGVELRMESRCGEGDDVVVRAPDKWADRAVNAFGGEVSRGSSGGGEEVQIRSIGPVHPRAVIGNPFSVGRDLQTAEGASRREELRHFSVRCAYRKNTIRIFIGFRVIGGGNDDVVAAGEPVEILDFPRGRDEFASLARFDVEQPKLCALIVLVGDVRVVLVLFLLFLGIRFGIRSCESDLLAVRRPFEGLDAALTFRERVSFAAIVGKEINLRLIAAIRKEAQAGPFGRPTRGKLQFTAYLSKRSQGD